MKALAFRPDFGYGREELRLPGRAMHCDKCTLGAGPDPKAGNFPSFGARSSAPRERTRAGATSCVDTFAHSVADPARSCVAADLKGVGTPYATSVDFIPFHGGNRMDYRHVPSTRRAMGRWLIAAALGAALCMTAAKSRAQAALPGDPFIAPTIPA